MFIPKKRDEERAKALCLECVRALLRRVRLPDAANYYPALQIIKRSPPSIVCSTVRAVLLDSPAPAIEQRHFVYLTKYNPNNPD